MADSPWHKTQNFEFSVQVHAEDRDPTSHFMGPHSEGFRCKDPMFAM